MVVSNSSMGRESTEDETMLSNEEKTTSYNGLDKKVESTREGGAFDTKAKKLIIISISVYSFITSSAFSMVAPFFPGEASKKDTNSAVVGLIFAVYPLVIILLSPIIALLIPKLGTKFMLSLGLILEGGSQIIFGFVHLMPTKETFIAYSFIIRIFSGVGAATTSTASMTLLSQNFKGHIASAMGVMQLFAGFGLMAGPPIGGFLYAAGGFQLPFLLIGILAILSLIPLYFVLPPDEIKRYTVESGGRSFLSLLKIPAVLVIAFAVAFSGVAISFLDPTLEPHLEKPFHLTSSEVGLMFFISPAAYAAAAPPVGMLANKWSERSLIVLGAVVCGFGYVFLGPAPFLPAKVFPSTLWLNGISLAVSGIGDAMFCVPALADMNTSALLVCLYHLTFADISQAHKANEAVAFP